MLYFFKTKPKVIYFVVISFIKLVPATTTFWLKLQVE